MLKEADLGRTYSDTNREKEVMQVQDSLIAYLANRICFEWGACFDASYLPQVDADWVDERQFEIAKAVYEHPEYQAFIDRYWPANGTERKARKFSYVELTICELVEAFYG